MTASGPAIALHCLGGERAPESIAADLRVLARLPERARARFWDALGEVLRDPVPASAEASLDAFARAFQVPDDDLARALKASRFLVREACARGLDSARFEEDIVRLAGGPLSPDAVVLAPLLLSGYEGAKAIMRRAMLAHTIADHSDVLESIEWRIDAVLSSSRGDALGGRIATLTLGYRRGDRTERVTLHMSPQKIEELRRACEQMLR